MSATRRCLEARAERIGEELRKEKAGRARAEVLLAALTNLVGRGHAALSSGGCRACGAGECGRNHEACAECDWVYLVGRELERIYVSTGVRQMATQPGGSA